MRRLQRRRLARKYKTRFHALQIRIKRLEFIKAQSMTGQYFSMTFQRLQDGADPETAETSVRRKVRGAVRGLGGGCEPRGKGCGSVRGLGCVTMQRRVERPCRLLLQTPPTTSPSPSPSTSLEQGRGTISGGDNFVVQESGENFPRRNSRSV